MSSESSLKPKYVHPEGSTRLGYSPDGLHLYTVGENQIIRKFSTLKEDDEPAGIEHHQDSITGVLSTNDKFITCSEDATVSLFNGANNEFETMLLRTTLPIRDISLSPDEEWLAVASDETVAKVVSLQDITKTVSLRPHTTSVRSIAYCPTGDHVATCMIDGTVTFFAISDENASVVKTMHNLAPAYDNDNTACKVAWHSNGSYFAVPTITRDIAVYSRDTWEKIYSFKSGHIGPIADFAWSPNCAFLATAGQDGKLLVWDCSNQVIVATHVLRNICAISWHPQQNCISATTTRGQLFTLKTPVPETLASRLLRRGNALRDITNESDLNHRRKSSRAQESEDGSLPDGDDLNWIEDDDGAGYVPTEEELNAARKRTHGEIEDGFDEEASNKRTQTSLRVHDPVQVGSTPWRGNRRYLVLNMVGQIWSVQQEATHNTVTVEFMDQEAHRRYHFQDLDFFEKACLNDDGALFASPASSSAGSVIQYRPHESWTMNAEWRVTLPAEEEAEGISLSNKTAVVVTSKGYVRVYSVTGVLLRIYRQKSGPVVSCAAWQNYVLTVANGSVRADGQSELVYSIEHIEQDELVQTNDIVALPPGGKLTAVFFSEEGDPYIYDSEEVLSVLKHWRVPGQAQWVPVLDTKLLSRREGREEYYWPVTASQDLFHCIILRGKERNPYFPRPMLSELEFSIPVAERPSDQSNKTINLEEKFLRDSLFLSLMDDSLSSSSTAAERASLNTKQGEIDRSLLQLIQLACVEEKGARALGLASLLRRDASFEAARKIALHYNNTALAQRMTSELSVNRSDE